MLPHAHACKLIQSALGYCNACNMLYYVISLVPLGGMPHGGMPPEAPYARYNLGQQNTTGMYLIHFKATFGISRQIEVSVVSSGGGALMEHPWEAQEEEKVSVWRLRCHEEWVMRLPHAHRHRIEQWLYGSAGVKPTCIRALHLGPPSIVECSLQEGAELWRSRPTQGLRGRGADGKFRTAKAKEYPSALCRSLIVSVLRGLNYRIRTFGTGEPAQLTAHDQSWVTHMCQQSQVLAQGSYLPDYQGLEALNLLNQACPREVNSRRWNGKKSHPIKRAPTHHSMRAPC
jgi:hypothetical protein